MKRLAPNIVLGYHNGSPEMLVEWKLKKKVEFEISYTHL